MPKTNKEPGVEPDWEPSRGSGPDPDRDSGRDSDRDSDRDWALSFAGCGFMGVYYIGGAACLLQWCPELLQRAPRVYGSSAGSLLGAMVTTGISLESVCSELMSLAQTARSHRLGPLHPSFNLMQQVRDILGRTLPSDAYTRASGRLFVSVTRVPSRENHLLSEFSSNEELIQALICSCFVPFYCGIIPPTFRGERYVDGAVSDNLPRCHLNPTITFSPYAGESDVCPRPQGQLYMSQVRFNNLSFEVNPQNLYRVATTFFPPEPQVMAEICQSGYTDALRFLKENGLIDTEVNTEGPQTPCCEWEHLFQTETTNQFQDNEIGMGQTKASGEDMENLQERRLKNHSWLDPRITEKLPPEIRAVLCRSCRLASPPSGLFSQLKSFLPRPRSPWNLAHRLVEWLPELPRDMSWLYSVFSPSWSKEEEAELIHSEIPLRRCKSLPSGLEVFNQSELAPPTSLTWDQSHASVPPTLVCSPAPGPGASWGFVGWIRNVTLLPAGRKKCNK